MTDNKLGKGGMGEEQDLSECIFFQDLLEKLNCLELKFEQSCLSDWLQTLTDIELQFLIETTIFINEYGCCEVCSDCEDGDCEDCDEREECEMDEYDVDDTIVLKMLDIAHLTALIYSMETGEDTVEFDEEEVGTHLCTMIYCSCVESFRRQGKAKYKVMRLTDEEIDADLNELQLDCLNDGLKKFFEEHEEKK